MADQMDTIIEDVSKELTKLREMAHSLGLPNADAINWSSDSAATQKRFLPRVLRPNGFSQIEHSQ